MNPQKIAILVVAATLGLLVVLLLLYGRPRRTRQEALPTNFSKGDPDSILEGPRLVKVQVWGVASAILITGFLAFTDVYLLPSGDVAAVYGAEANPIGENTVTTS